MRNRVIGLLSRWVIESGKKFFRLNGLYDSMTQRLKRLAAVFLFVLTAAVPAFADQAFLSFQATFQGVALIWNLNASSGPAANQITLSWTAPDYNGSNPPLSYLVKASTTGDITTTGQFNAANSLSVFTTAFSTPGVLAAGTTQSMTVSALQAGVQYCFAIRAQDSGPAIGAWLKSAAKGYNVNNCAMPFAAGPKAPIEPLGVMISTTSTTA